jgi:hypothetical protein
LSLRLKRDDGAIVYLNGREAARSSMPAGEVLASTPANNASDDGQSFDVLSVPTQLLHAGENVLTVELHQATPSSSDASFDLELGATLQGSQSNGNALPVFTRNTVVKARAFDGKQWSALNQVLFQVGDEMVGPGDLMVREMQPQPAGMADTEFLELQNVSNRGLNLRGTRFTNGIDFAFSPYLDHLVAPGERLVLVKNLFDFQQTYGFERPVAGIYRGSLDNGGEALALVSATGTGIFRFQYSNKAPWPTGANGTGRTLVMAFPELDPTNPVAWRLSASSGGNPWGNDNSWFSGDIGADVDGDGYSALLEYAMGADDREANVPGNLRLSLGVDDTLTLNLSRSSLAEDVELWAEASSDLEHWSRMSRLGIGPLNQTAVLETWGVSATSGLPVFVRVAAQVKPIPPR